MLSRRECEWPDEQRCSVADRNLKTAAARQGRWRGRLQWDDRLFQEDREKRGLL